MTKFCSANDSGVRKSKSYAVFLLVHCVGYSHVQLFLAVTLGCFFHFSENSHVVKLQKSSSGLGLSIAGGTDADVDPLRRVVRIKQIFPASPAAVSAQLLVGDVILQVNGTRTSNMKRSVSFQLLQKKRVRRVGFAERVLRLP